MIDENLTDDVVDATEEVKPARMKAKKANSKKAKAAKPVKATKEPKVKEAEVDDDGFIKVEAAEGATLTGFETSDAVGSTKA